MLVLLVQAVLLRSVQEHQAPVTLAHLQSERVPRLVVQPVALALLLEMAIVEMVVH
jgi:hypothetical protein